MPATCGRALHSKCRDRRAERACVGKSGGASRGGVGAVLGPAVVVKFASSCASSVRGGNPWERALAGNQCKPALAALGLRWVRCRLGAATAAATACVACCVSPLHPWTPRLVAAPDHVFALPTSFKVISHPCGTLPRPAPAPSLKWLLQLQSSSSWKTTGATAASTMCFRLLKSIISCAANGHSRA